jgi:hypothetical protein
MDYPDDADGDALRRLAEDGSDLSQPMDVDFAVAVPDEKAGHALARLAASRGYRPELSQDEETGEWTCSCTRSMAASYEALIAAQAELDVLAGPLGGYADGWGSFGNAG